MNLPSSHSICPFLVPMSVEHTPPIPDPGLDSRIQQWMSSLPNDLSRHQLHQRLPSDAIGRADSPLLGFAPQESASHDPLHRPSPNYIRRLPEEVTLTNKRTFHDKLLPLPSQEARLPSPVPEDGEQDFSFPNFPYPPVTRDFPSANLARYKTHSSLPPMRRPIARQPSLPIFGTTAHLCHVSDHPRIRSHSTATPPRTELHMQSLTPHTTASTTPVMPTATVSSQLERQRLDALVIASGLAADEEEPQVEGLGLHSSPSQVYLGDPESREVPTPVERRSSHDSDAITTTYQSQTVSSPRTSTSLEDLDEFDEDASYYGKEINTLFSPYSRPPSVSGPADVEIAEPAASKWSLSSSVQMDLEKSRRSSPTKSLKNRRDKIKSFISRFTPNSPPLTTDKHVSIMSSTSLQKRLHRERSHSDVRASFTSRSSQIHGVAHGSWESVPPTPTTVISSTTMSVSTGYSPVTPSDSESDPRNVFRVSEEKLAGGAGLSRVNSSVFTCDTSSFVSGTDTSVPNSPVDAVLPQLPLKHAVSTASLRINGFKGLASRIGLTPAENLYEESVNEVQKASPLLSQAPPPRSFKERMMLKNNGSALSLILGMGNKSSKSKRKLLISGVEKGDRRKYEAISNWCEGFGQVIVKQVENGAIIADFRDASVAESVCRLQAQVYITGAGSVSLSWTTKKFLN